MKGEDLASLLSKAASEAASKAKAAAADKDKAASTDDSAAATATATATTTAAADALDQDPNLNLNLTDLLLKHTADVEILDAETVACTDTLEQKHQAEIQHHQQNSDNAAASSDTSSTRVDPAVHAARQSALARELLVEHFGFVPTEVVDDIINAVNSLLYQTISALEEFVEEKLQGDEDAVEKGMVAVETLLENAVDGSFDKFELFVLNNIFKVPSGVFLTLPHYIGVDPVNVETARKEIDDIDAKIKTARRKLQAARYFQDRIQTKVGEIDSQMPQLMALKENMEKVMGASGYGSSPLPETLSFLSSHLSALRTASSTALHRTSSLPHPSAPVLHQESRPRAIANMVSEYLDRAAKRQKTDGDLLTTDAGGDGGKRKDVAVGGMVAATAAAVDEEALCSMKDVGSVPQGLKEASFNLSLPSLMGAL